MCPVARLVMMVLFQTSLDAPGERREETTMINHTDMELRFAAHETRVGRANRDGWMRQVSAPDSGTRQQTTVIGSGRQQLGSAVVRIGKWLRGVPFTEAIEPVRDSPAP